jgi:CRISPR-associated protein Cmr5
MNRKRIERLIPEAMGQIKTKLLDKGKVPKIYDGYIAAFGPSVISSGLLQCVKFYEGDAKRKKVTQIFYNLLKTERQDCDENSLDAFLEKNKHYADFGIRREILDIAVACKLAVRTFELTNDSDDETKGS